MSGGNGSVCLWVAADDQLQGRCVVTLWPFRNCCEDRSELPQPAIYSLNTLSMHLRRLLSSILSFRSANKLAHPPLVIDYCVFLPGNIHPVIQGEIGQRNQKNTKKKLRLCWLGISPDSLYYIKVKPGAARIMLQIFFMFPARA